MREVWPLISNIGHSSVTSITLTPPRAAIFAAKEVLQVLKEDGETERYEDRMATWMDREVAVNTKWWNEREAEYLGLD